MGKYQDYTPDLSKHKAVGFSLYGIDFDCQPALPFGVITDFADKFASLQITEEDAAEIEKDPSKGTDSLKMIMDAVDELFSTAIIEPEQYDEWQKIIRDPKRVVLMSTLMDIAMDLLDQYMTDEAGNDRPTGSRSSKRSGKKSRGAGSVAGARPATSTYTRSEQIGA